MKRITKAEIEQHFKEDRFIKMSHATELYDLGLITSDELDQVFLKLVRED